MKVFKKTKGAISVFLCITVSAFILCMGLLVDIIKISSSSIQQEDIAVSCMRSALSLYDPMLFDRFKIMGINQDENIEQVMERLFSENSITKEGSLVVPYHNIVVKTEKMKSLEDHIELKRQVINEEKNRLADKFMDDIMNKIRLLTDIKGEKNPFPLINDSNVILNDSTQRILKDIEGQAETYIKGTVKDLIPVFDGENVKSEKAEDFLQSSIDLVKKAGLNLAENMLINEYIIQYLEKYAERIITGQNNIETADATVKAMILGVRTVANTIYFLSDPELMSIASSLAAATAGWTVLGIPVAQAAIILAWCTAESLLDMETMYSGEKVPLYKSKNTWVLSAFGMAEKMGEKVKNEAVKAAKGITDSAVDSVKEYVDAIVLQLDTYANNAVASAVELITKPLTDIVSQAESLTSKKIEEMQHSCKSMIEQRYNGANQFEKLAFNYVLEKMDEVFLKIDELLNDRAAKMTDYIQEQRNRLKDEIIKPVEKYKNKLLDSISQTAEKGKEAVAQKLQELLGEEKGISGDGSLSNKVLASFTKLSYQDYLRFFLLTCGDEKKISGINNGIEEEMSGTYREFTLDNMITVWKGTFKEEVRYYFVPSSLIPKVYKSEDGHNHMLIKQYEFGYDRGITACEN